MTDKDKEKLVDSVNEFITQTSENREPVVIEKETFITVPVHAERTTPSKGEKFELQPIDHQAYPDTIRELENLPLSRQFAPVFNAEVARRHLYKDLILRLNKELKEGPLEGLMVVTGVRHDRGEIRFDVEPKMRRTRFGDSLPSFSAMNRTRAYNTHFHALLEKYREEIRGDEAKVMERE